MVAKRNDTTFLRFAMVFLGWALLASIHTVAMAADALKESNEVTDTVNGTKDFHARPHLRTLLVSTAEGTSRDERSDKWHPTSQNVLVRYISPSIIKSTGFRTLVKVLRSDN
ncbi:hypothetical protein CCR75_009033 [Bremia lactucae]|uniref:RxLR effector protein n=1 Tax=Bremia lactucae TaxID=4779 RepID=A0A976FHN7_BRELC|nr:hypothetical protein CCR75_009033 [Bremia lactucae]